MTLDVSRDVAAGFLFAGIGVAFALGSLSYRMGSLVQMGPGFFPFWVAIFLIGMGSVVVLHAAVAEHREQIERIRPMVLVFVILPVALFAIALPYLGLPATVSLIVVVALKTLTQASWRFVLATGALLSVIATVIFITMLSLPINTWPWFVR